jgi:hypothetical protein
MQTKVKFRDQLKEYVRKEFGTELGQVHTVKQSKLMTQFYVREIQKVITPGLVPSDEDDFESCVIDGPNDCGVDFFSRAEGMALIIQGKCRGYGIPEKVEEFIHFCEVLKRLHPVTGSKYAKNQKLLEAIADIDWENDIFELQYISLGRAVDGIRTRAEEGPTLDDSALASLKDRCELTISDESDLNVKLREALSTGEMIVQPVKVHFLPDDDGGPWLKLCGARKRAVYIGFVNGGQIAELYQPHRFRLFAMNIRDWVGDTATNKGIVSTAEKQPNNFLFFNNGISAVATSIEERPDDLALVCKNFSIINGAQTVRSLFKARSRSMESLKETAVMMRISTFSLGKEPEFLDDVTKYNNTQNKVAVSDFRSNDPVQRDLASQFARLKRGAKSFWYKNKRSREKLDRIPIEMEEFAKTIHSFKYGPHDMWGGTARLFDTGKDGRYALVFGDGQEVWAKVPEEDFQVLSGIWFVCESIRQIWKEEKERRPKDQVSGLALERRYMVYYAVGELLRMIYEFKGASLDFDLRKLANPRWTEKDGVEKSVIREVTDLAFTGLVKAYETASHEQDFRHRNWFRDRKYMEGVRSDLKFIRDIKKAALPTLAGS